ncbi:hypothetical protein DM02DRAFT_656070 [Periconia macrospinosa]|uniref:Uncharacterized protein n=1 Tax=Periconia macrospinosa TaxID=97972 RepID=A0A2V1DNI2_9PLEO|nr:hypothetical protein DM02DRAFT_656070 [Periconia macrospinosa]
MSWRDYFNYLSTELDLIREQVLCQPDLKSNTPSDTIEFSHLQSLEIIQTKARRAGSILSTTAQRLGVMKSLVEKIDHRQSKKDYEFETNNERAGLKMEIVKMDKHLKLHEQQAGEIIESVISVNKLIQQMLELRNYSALHANNAKLQQLSTSQASETSIMLQLAVIQRQEARVMRVASIIALVYLPVSLVSSLFSTQLFTLNSIVLNMREGLGIFFTLLLTLTVSTILSAYLWLPRDPTVLRQSSSSSP